MCLHVMSCLIQYIYLIQSFQIPNMTWTTNIVNKLQFLGCSEQMQLLPGHYLNNVYKDMEIIALGKLYNKIKLLQMKVT